MSSRIIFLSLFALVEFTSFLAQPGHAQEPGASPASSEIHYVAPDDVLEIKVFQEDDLETKARVSQNGSINFPLIGMVMVAGKTPEEAARAIRAALAKDYLVNPQVTLTVVEYSKRRFTVLGQVQKPGSYDMPDRNSVTLLQAIGTAGGYTRIADPSKIRLKRLESGKETVFKLDAKSMANERQTATFEIKPGDIITVGESFF
jgi:polysaccharide export outer membrane protein